MNRPVRNVPIIVIVIYNRIVFGRRKTASTVDAEKRV